MTMDPSGTSGRVPKLSAERFRTLAQFFADSCGIELPASKRPMAEARLMRRLRTLQLSSFDDYLEVLFESGNDEERRCVIDLLTTHKTDFFRESHHFDFLRDRIVRPFCGLWSGQPRELRVWSAGCSTGEEPYSISMVLQQSMGAHSFRVLATDVSEPSLVQAQKGQYPVSAGGQIPPHFRAFYERTGRHIAVSAAIRRAVDFRTHNLMSPDYPYRPRHHVIFIRNTLIYFTRERQREILARLTQCLVPRGFLFLGHSESLSGLDLPYTSVWPTVFRRVAS